MVAEPGQLWSGDITFERDTSRDIYESGSGDTPTPVTHTYVGDRLYGWTKPGETLYAWTAPTGYSVLNSRGEYMNTIYTKTPNPTYDVSTGVFPEIFDEEGVSCAATQMDISDMTVCYEEDPTGSVTDLTGMSSSAITFQSGGPV